MEPTAAFPPDPALSPLRSVHTASVAALLDQARATVAVTTYQAGKLVFLRPEPSAGGMVVNTHFRGFAKPMGFAWERGRFAIGTAMEIIEFHDLPAACPGLDAVEQPTAAGEVDLPSEPPETSPVAMPHHDAAFFPRIIHHTGDIQIHEMVWSNPGNGQLSELWFVNTRFSCLATRSEIYSFMPRWKPAFISKLVPEDRCHLNGLALRDGKPRYVTALGQTDTAGGWRAGKQAGGVVMDIQSDDILCHGLSMPHSPRWRDGQLWVLESGNGSVGLVDQARGKYQEVCRLPGFTRGLSFIGPFALVGLSQVRESASFSGIAIAQMPLEQRRCGVWVVDIRSGTIVGFVQFTDGVQEIFAVNVLPGIVRPDCLHEDRARVANAFELPDQFL